MSRKSIFDIKKNEQYMNDAFSSAFLNLHKAAKRKTEYIWATKGFSSLDCIYNNPTELETGKIHDNAKENKICETSQGNLMNQKQSLLSKSTSKKDGKRTVYFVSESKYTDLLNGKLASNAKISELTESSQILKTDKLRGSSLKQNIHESNQYVGSNISEEKQSFGDINSIKTKNGDKSSFENEQAACNFGISVSAYDVAINQNVKPSNDGTEIKSNCQRNIINNRRKKMHLSTSANSLIPEQKTVKNQKYTNKSQNCDKKVDFLKTMLLLKIFNSNKVFEIVLELNDFERMIEKFPKLKEVLPEIDKEEKEVEFSAESVRLVFGFLRSLPPHDAPDERTSVEVLAAFKSWEINHFRLEKFQNELLGLLANSNKKNISLAYRAAVHYGLEEICDAFKHFNDSDLFFSKRSYRQRKCYISVTTYIEPRAFRIPLETATSTLKDNFDRDIKNEISFKAIRGSYVITGFHIVLNLDNETNTDLDITSYVIRNQENYEELKIRKPLRSNIAINLKKNLEVDQDETVEIIVETTIKPYFCLAIKENCIAGMDNEGQFCMSLKSTFKVSNSNALRFFIGKLLYYPKT